MNLLNYKYAVWIDKTIREIGVIDLESTLTIHGGKDE